MAARKLIETQTGEDPEILIADQRYQFIDKVIDSAVERPRDNCYHTLREN